MDSVLIDQHTIRRFLGKTRREGKCVVWIGCRSKKGGYGKFYFQGDVCPAHRAAWQIYHKRCIPKGKFVLHSCDNPPCIRKKHLFLGSQLLNMRDASRKGRLVGNRTIRGERNLKAVLTRTDVIAIRKSAMGDAALARRFGVAPLTIYDVRKRRTWKHLK